MGGLIHNFLLHVWGFGLICFWVICCQKLELFRAYQFFWYGKNDPINILNMVPKLVCKVSLQACEHSTASPWAPTFHVLWYCCQTGACLLPKAPPEGWCERKWWTVPLGWSGQSWSQLCGYGPALYKSCPPYPHLTTLWFSALGHDWDIFQTGPKRQKLRKSQLVDKLASYKIKSSLLDLDFVLGFVSGYRVKKRGRRGQMGGAQVATFTCAPPISGNMIPVSEALVLPLSNVRPLTLSISSQIYIQHSGN